MKTKITFGILFAVYSTISANPVSLSVLEKIEEFSVLNYGDPCSYEVEEMRQNYTNVLIKNMNQNLGNALEKMADVSKSFRNTRKPYCQAKKSWTCNKETGRCDCGDPGLFSIFGEKKGREKFVFEDNKCRWAPESYCIPSDYLEQKYGQDLAEHLGCSYGTSCTETSSGEECTFSTMVEHVRKTGGVNFMTDLFSGVVCKCQPDIMFNLIEDSGTEMDKKTLRRMYYNVDKKRKKRDTSNIEAEDVSNLFDSFVSSLVY